MKSAKKRSKILLGQTFQKITGCGKLYVTINKGEDGKVHEVFCKLGKNGSCFATCSEAVARMITLVFRLDGDPLKIAGQLQGIRCPKPTPPENGETYHSCIDAIGKAIQEFSSTEIDKPGK